MNARRRRRLRPILLATLLVGLPVTGFVWALPSALMSLGGGLLLSMLCMALAFGAEFLAGATEREFHLLRASAESEEKDLSLQLAVQKEAVRDLDRIVESIAGQNSMLRHSLLREKLRQGGEAAMPVADNDSAPRGKPRRRHATAQRDASLDA